MAADILDCLTTGRAIDRTSTEAESLRVADGANSSEADRLSACVRLATIWGNTINRDQLQTICEALNSIRWQRSTDVVNVCCPSFAIRMKLIESITIDKEKYGDDEWLEW